MAERVGFEPTIPVKVYTLSKRAPSATRPSLRKKLRGSSHCTGVQAACRGHVRFTAGAREPPAFRNGRSMRLSQHGFGFGKSLSYFVQRLALPMAFVVFQRHETAAVHAVDV